MNCLYDSSSLGFSISSWFISSVLVFVFVFILVFIFVFLCKYGQSGLVHLDCFSKQQYCLDLFSQCSFSSCNSCSFVVVKDSGVFVVRITQDSKSDFLKQIFTTSGKSSGFDFRDFELGDLEELIGQFPKHDKILNRLCRNISESNL